DYLLTYQGFTTTLNVCYQNTALTISQLMEQSADGQTVYELTGVVVRPVTSYASAELLIKEKDSNVVVGIWSNDTIGSTYNLKLDTKVLNYGDEIIIKVTYEKSTDTAGGMKDKKIVKALDGKISLADLVVLSKGNDTSINLTDDDVTEIYSQDQLVKFLSSSKRYYSYVKIININFTYYTNSYNMFYGASVSTSSGAKVDTSYAQISMYNTAGLTTAFSEFVSEKTYSYSEPATSTKDFYMLFIGGDSSAHHFVVLQDNWVFDHQHETVEGKENVIEATCTSAGFYEKVVKCTTCNKYLSRESVIEGALGHDLVSVPAKAPGCGTVGWNDYSYCSRCDYTTYVEIPTDTPHTPTEWIMVTEPTHLEEGLKIKNCTNCGEIAERQVMPKVEVTLVAPTKTTYSVDEQIVLDGASITFNYLHKDPVTVAITADMIGEYNTSIAGQVVVPVSYQGYESHFEIIVVDGAYTLSQAVSMQGTADLAQRGVKAYIVAFDTTSSVDQTIEGVYLSDGKTIYWLGIETVQIDAIAYSIGDEVYVSNVNFDHSNGGRVIEGSIYYVASTGNSVDLSAIAADKVITNQEELVEWASQTTPAKALIVRFEGEFSFVGTGRTQGQGTRLQLNYNNADSSAEARYTWNLSEYASKTISFKYAINGLLIPSWWSTVGANSTGSASTEVTCHGSFTAVSGSTGNTMWSWAFVDATTWDAHKYSAGNEQIENIVA
ncbi:MAG: hypothetical protein J6Q55_00730, partial [Clostridia bacterium]|nr:hypothetical protein [Clostridia bacterium]